MHLGGAHSTFADVLLAWAEARGDSVAMSTERHSLTYAEWHEGSRKVAASLRDRVEPGDRVGILCDRSSWTSFATAYLGAQLAATVPTPLDVSLGETELRRCVESASCSVVLDCLPGTAGGSLADLSIEDALTASDGGPRRRPLEVADIIFTSGTTGRPRGIVSQFGDLLSGSRMPASWRGRALLHGFPPTSAAGVHGAMTLGLRSGVEVRSLPGSSLLDPGPMVDAVCREDVVALYLLPSVASILVGAFDGRPVDHLRMVFLTGSASSSGLLATLDDTIPQASIVNLYGATEAGQAQTFMLYDPERPDALGRPMGRTEVGIRLPDGWAPVGERGEVCLRRKDVPQRRYVDRTDAVADAGGGDRDGAFLEDGWVATGDVGFIDDGGYLHVVDRIKDIIIRGGENVSAPRIEETLQTHPDVVEASVVAGPSLVGGESIVAFVVLHAGAACPDLRAHVSLALPRSSVPQRFMVIDELPRNSAGKVRKDVLRQLASSMT